MKSAPVCDERDGPRRARRLVTRTPGRGGAPSAVRATVVRTMGREGTDRSWERSTGGVKATDPVAKITDGAPGASTGLGVTGALGWVGRGPTGLASGNNGQL